jgi:hypothetical protein
MKVGISRCIPPPASSCYPSLASGQPLNTCRQRDFEPIAILNQMLGVEPLICDFVSDTFACAPATTERCVCDLRSALG